MELKRDDTKMLQGLSTIAMLLLHLFCRYDFAGLYQPSIFIAGYPLTFYLGQVSDFCVMGFAFCSGYGHYKSMEISSEGYYKRQLKHLLQLYFKFWVICCLFTLISVIMGRNDYMPGDFVEFLLNITSVNVTYNGAWWYLFIYAVIVVLSPLLLKATKKFNSILLLFIGGVIYLTAYYVRFYTPGHGWLLEKFGTFGMTLFEYLIGAIFCKTQILTKSYNMTTKVAKNSFVRDCLAVVTVLAIILIRTHLVRSLFVAPATGLIIMVIFHYWKKPNFIRKTFLYIGQHSTAIWLTHMFFFTTHLFDGLVFKAKYPILIFVFILLLCFVSSYIVNGIYKFLEFVCQRIIRYVKA